MRKNIFLILLMFGLFAFLACEKDSPTAILSSNIAPNELQALSQTDYVLLMDDAALTFEEFGWVAPDYGFQASIRYVLQMDTAGNDFANAVEVLSSEHTTSGSISIGDFNKKMLDYGCETGVPIPIEFRVISIINQNVDTVYSTVKGCTVTAYATVFPPIYMCGAATGGWNWDSDVEMRSTGPSVYYTIAYFLNGETFRFFAQPSWDATQYKYAFFTTVDTDLEAAGDGDDNFRVVGASDYYEITVDLKNKTIVMAPIALPELFMTGDALGGWDWDTNFEQFTWVKHGVFEATTNFANNGTFRFFAQAGWSTSYNYPYFADGQVSALLENAADGDSNFRFVGTTGDYIITVNMLDLIVEMVAVVP